MKHTGYTPGPKPKRHRWSNPNTCADCRTTRHMGEGCTGYTTPDGTWHDSAPPCVPIVDAENARLTARVERLEAALRITR